MLNHHCHNRARISRTDNSNHSRTHRRRRNRHRHYLSNHARKFLTLFDVFFNENQHKEEQMAAATDPQMQRFADERVRVRAEQIRDLFAG